MVENLIEQGYGKGDEREFTKLLVEELISCRRDGRIDAETLFNEPWQMKEAVVFWIDLEKHLIITPWTNQVKLGERMMIRGNAENDKQVDKYGAKKAWFVPNRAAEAQISVDTSMLCADGDKVSWEPKKWLERNPIPIVSGTNPTPLAPSEHSPWTKPVSLVYLVCRFPPRM